MLTQLNENMNSSTSSGSGSGSVSNSTDTTNSVCKGANEQVIEEIQKNEKSVSMKRVFIMSYIQRLKDRINFVKVNCIIITIINRLGQNKYEVVYEQQKILFILRFMN